VTMGIVSAKGRRDLSLTSDQSVTNQDFIQTDAAINPGNSGGPLIDIYGSVVGINTAIASNSGGNEGIGFSIPSNLVKHVFDQMVQHGKVRRAYLGVELDNNFTDAAAQRLGLSRALGARIVRVYSHKSSPAVIAGLRPDDVIVSFNNPLDTDAFEESIIGEMLAADDIEGARRRLTLFLVQFWGGPATYLEERGHPMLRMRHLPFLIGPAQRDAWLVNMRAAIDAVDPHPVIRTMLLDYFEPAAEALRNDTGLPISRPAAHRPRT